MKKVSLLVGTLGGAMAGYLFSNKKLREQLSKAKDSEEVAALLGKHLQKDGKSLAKHVKAFVESEDVQTNLTKAKSYASDHLKNASTELKKMVSDGKKKVIARPKKKVAKKKAKKK